MITRATPSIAPATLINAVLMTLFFEVLGPEEELPRENDSKHLGDATSYAITYLTISRQFFMRLSCY